MAAILPLINVLGFIVTLFALTMIIPLLFALIGADAGLPAFYESFTLLFAGGLLAWLGTRHFKRELHVRDGFLLVSLVWTVLPACATLPLLAYFKASGAPLSFTDAYFETVSAMTTSGATVLSGLDQLPISINVWRTFLQWLGGMGILVLAVAILPLLGVGGSQVFKAETPGPMKENKLTPRIAETAKGLYGVYFAISLACFLCYWKAGMSKADAFMHMCSTLSLGGLSSHDANFAYFNSVSVEIVAMIFMTIASCNFAMHFVAFRKRSLRPLLRDAETRGTLLALLFSSLLIAFYLLDKKVYPDFATALRYASFNLISVASTTGYVSTDFSVWPMFAPIWMLFLSAFTTSAGSTGAGIKMVRALLLLKQVRREFLRILHPRATCLIKLNNSQVDNSVMIGVLAFMLLYGGTVIMMTFLLLLSDMDLVSAFSTVISAINNMGPVLTRVGPVNNLAALTDFQTWVCTATMLLGRLEIFSLLIIFTPTFWRK
ncbi:MAG: TrkH family potassium uptake protein [Burkholderiaceae bacterium]|nr:MAG: TrkH family potassium uptake protein [Burkholderiaceae bacterium]